MTSVLWKPNIPDDRHETGIALHFAHPERDVGVGFLYCGSIDGYVDSRDA
jgi:hypothetical protein